MPNNKIFRDRNSLVHAVNEDWVQKAEQLTCGLLEDHKAQALKPLGPIPKYIPSKTSLAHRKGYSMVTAWA